MVLCCSSDEVTAGAVDESVDPVAETTAVTSVLSCVVLVCSTSEFAVLSKVLVEPTLSV